MDLRERVDLEEFQAKIDEGGTVTIGDPMPEEYRRHAARITGYQSLAEIVGAMMYGEWISQTPSLLRKMMITAKVQDEMGHAHYVMRIAEDMGLGRKPLVEGYMSGKNKVLNIFHYRIETWHEWPISAYLANSSALIQFRSLRNGSFLPYTRALQRIMKEESFHYHNALDLMQQLVEQGPEHHEKVQEGLNKWWPRILAYFGPSDHENEHQRPVMRYRLKVDTNDTLRQKWLSREVPTIRSIGLEIPDPKLRYDQETETWEYTEPDWEEVRYVINGNGPASQYWKDAIRDSYRPHGWVRRLVYGEGRAA